MLMNKRQFVSGLAIVAVSVVSSCSRPSTPTGVRKMPAGQQYSGFLGSYDQLKPNPTFENTLSYVSADPIKNVHKYIAVIVDPPVVYVATDADETSIPDRGRAALSEYFQHAITNAVADAFPVVHSSGPLVLRLRSAIIGVDIGPESEDQQDDKVLRRGINIGKVGVEMELVDSETGAQVAAAIDRQNLGADAVVGSVTFSREQKFRAATQAFDGWAARLREFLDSAHELSKEDVARIEGSNFPYASQGTDK